MITCPRCGFQAPDGSPWCPRCGYGCPYPVPYQQQPPQQMPVPYQPQPIPAQYDVVDVPPQPDPEQAPKPKKKNKMPKWLKIVLISIGTIVFLFVAVIVAALIDASNDPEVTPTPTMTITSTFTVTPTYTASPVPPTSTPIPSDTPMPTNTSVPAVASEPTKECRIKGNINDKGDHIYHCPNFPNYDSVKIDNFGEKMFCTEDEAIAAGFRKPANAGWCQE